MLLSCDMSPSCFKHYFLSQDVSIKPLFITKKETAILLFFKDFIYLFDRERSQVDGEAGREREREREAGSLLSREPDVGLDPRTLRS